MIHVVEDIYVDKIIGCGIDKGSWELPIDGDYLFTQPLYLTVSKEKDSISKYVTVCTYGLIYGHRLDGIVKGNIPFQKDINSIGSGNKDCNQRCKRN